MTTPLPRWVTHPQPGTAVHNLALRPDLVIAMRRLAEELSVSTDAILSTAHVKVLGSLTGQSRPVTGQVRGDRVLPRRFRIDAGSWRQLIGTTAEDQQIEPDDHDFETLIDPWHGDVDLGPGCVLGVGFETSGDRMRLRLHYRRDAYSASAAARIAAYHLTALNLITTDVDADHASQSLLSAEELEFQLHGLAGTRREIPDLGFHRLFEARVRRQPHAIAAQHGDRQLTYAELNARANRLARALLSAGLRAEDPVAVITERNLDWMTAVLAVFKAGGAYLPIEPHFPEQRISSMLIRAECHLRLTPEAISAALDQWQPDDDLDVEVGPDQLAYIYFTSGSTGEPKGAMCEHAGMLNHLYAKIDDLGLTSSSVVSQTAPQCFDISLWQLISALIVGGRTLIVEQEAILDLPRFIRTIRTGRVTVMQLVPSYLDAVLTYLHRDRVALADLQRVSVTGEALPAELVRRWFAVMPGVRMVNAYGLTETSDDTNHESLESVPEGDVIPVGRLVSNVYGYVVDEELRPVPLGAPGEIVFSGVCVGRGYINDPERTRRAFQPDPYRPGQRLYRSGDFGRWRPDGKLEFLGRRDAQIKIRGFRIEIGEIESRLLQQRGVDHGAVVAVSRPDGSKQLVAFYTGTAQSDDLRSALAIVLPEYMVPSILHHAAALPLTGNGKVDRKTLTALAADLDPATEHEAPQTPAEERLAAAWAEVLGIPPTEIGRRDGFFDHGGTSLSAVKLAIALDRAVTVKDITARPVLADLASLLTTEGTPT